MGCWNHTCAVTGLPIYDGEKVEVIMLLTSNNSDDSSHCYPTSYHTPVPLTFQGQYNDYGAVENCTGVALPVLISAIHDRLFEMEVGENEYHDIAAKKDEFNVTKMFELNHENRLMITNHRTQFDMREAVPLNHIVIRKHVYDTIVENYKLDYWDNEKSITKFLTLKDLVKEYDALLKHLETVANNDNLLARYRIREKLGETAVAGLLAFRGQSSFGFNQLISINETLVSMYEKTDKNLLEFIDNAIRFSLFALFMMDTRRMWHVPSGVGSQNDDTENHVLVANLTIFEADKLKHRWDDE